jgi:hypothetical protein
MRRRAIVLVATALLAGAGCYSPNPQSGKLRCGLNFACPEGYMCKDGQTCWKASESPTGTGGTGGGGQFANFTGTWIFGSNAKNVVTCSDRPTTPSTTSLANDYVDITEGVGADLLGQYYCDWDLNVVGTTTAIVPGQSCMTTTMDQTVFTWHGDGFNFTTTDGKTATLSAPLSADYQDTTGATGTCTLMITGSLTKQ